MYKAVTPVLALICCLLYQAHATCDPTCATPYGSCGPDDLTCYCNVGYYGAECQTGDTANECGTAGTAACSGDEVCVTATTCSTDCATLACTTDGTCVTTGAATPTLECLCTTDYTGAKCECVVANVDYDPSTHTCWCKSGFGGADCTLQCDTDCTDGCTAAAATDCIDPTMCPASPCQGGTCTSYRHESTASVKCSCNAGFTGAYCDECTTDAGCTSKGTCDTTEGTCTCNSGNVGTFCQHACPAECPTFCTMKADGTGAECLDECASDIDCNSKGTCDTNTGDCTCTDTTNYDGTFCEQCKTDVGCNSMGSCTSGVCTCTDPANYGGLFCEKCKTDAGCSSNVTCDITEGTCNCDSGNVGTFCQHACPAECPTSCTLTADETGAECSGAVMVMTSLATIVMAVLGPFL